MLNKKVLVVLVVAVSSTSLHSASLGVPPIRYTLRNDSTEQVTVTITLPEEASRRWEAGRNPMPEPRILEVGQETTFNLPAITAGPHIGRRGEYEIKVYGRDPIMPQGVRMITNAAGQQYQATGRYMRSVVTRVFMSSKTNNFARIGPDFLVSEVLPGGAEELDRKERAEQAAREKREAAAEERKERIAERREAAQERRLEEAYGVASVEREIEAERKAEAIEDKVTKARERRDKRLKEKREAAADRRARSK